MERPSSQPPRPSERKLRLEELLHELGAEVPVAGAALRDGKLTMGELVDCAAEGGFGFLIGILSLIAIPFFGLSTPFGLAIALVGAQLAIGRQQPWLPNRARRRELNLAMLDRVAGMLERRTRWLARSTRRRYEAAIAPKLIGFCVVLLALGLALPIPIPGSNWVFLAPLFVFAIGLLERDGAWIAAGYVATVVDLALLIGFGGTVVAALEQVWHWVT
ncbi:MAG: exopolysaccharide biosynthesis protein [Kofleriaceae bacterium]